MILFFTAALLWQFQTASDPLGQPVYVASIAPDAARPFVHLKYSCGGIVGVELQFNLGEMQYAGAAFSRAAPEFEDVRFTFAEGKYDTAAKRAPITDGIATYEIKGSEAAFVAGLFKDSESVSVSRGSADFTFPLAGARFAIDEVMSACPFKYTDQ
ncbi:MAG: hypothetical protein JNK07_19805 [Alphaproteobacteria bacterium]|nr:hypothetical protein [Alphaproteobacteria bacterium]